MKPAVWTLLAGAGILLSGCYTMLERPGSDVLAERRDVFYVAAPYLYLPPYYGSCPHGDLTCAACRGEPVFRSTRGDAVVRKKGEAGEVRHHRDERRGTERVRAATTPSSKREAVRRRTAVGEIEGGSSRRDRTAVKAKKK